MLKTTNDPDNFETGVLRATRKHIEDIELDGVSDGVVIPEVLAGKGFIYHNYVSRRIDVRLRKQSAPRRLESECLEIPLAAQRVLRKYIRKMRTSPILTALFPAVRQEIRAATLLSPQRHSYLSELTAHLLKDFAIEPSAGT